METIPVRRPYQCRLLIAEDETLIKASELCSVYLWDLPAVGTFIEVEQGDRAGDVEFYHVARVTLCFRAPSLLFRAEIQAAREHGLIANAQDVTDVALTLLVVPPAE